MAAPIASARNSTRPASFAKRPRRCWPITSASAARAEEEAEQIVADAKAEAERMTEEANAKLEDMIARRTKSAEDKITQAQNQAVAEVRARAADLAIAASERVLLQKVKGRLPTSCWPRAWPTSRAA